MKFIIIVAIVILGISLVGCAASSKSCCGEAIVPRDKTPRELTVLTQDMTPLRTAFNAQSERWRVFSLVSPTCSECVLGAEAVEREITRPYPADQVSAITVWIPMLQSDNEDAARSSATIFPPDRATQFYDSRQAVGWAYSGKTFQGFIDRAIKSLPPEHPLAEHLRDRYERERPQWDLYMLYAPGVRWEASIESPPVPTHWIRHCGRIDGENSTYWRDTPDAPPREGNLFSAMREMAEQALGNPTARASVSGIRIEILGFEDCPNTPPLRANVQQAVTNLKLHATVEYIAQDKLAADDLRRGWPTPTVLVNGKDLFDMAPPNSPEMKCRVYSSGLPTAERIADRIGKLTAGAVSRVDNGAKADNVRRQIVFKIEGFT